MTLTHEEIREYGKGLDEELGKPYHKATIRNLKLLRAAPVIIEQLLAEVEELDRECQRYVPLCGELEDEVKTLDRCHHELHDHIGRLGVLRDESAETMHKLRAEVEELRLSRDCETGVLAMTVGRLGGQVEGQPTARGNFLQRIDELRGIEAERDKLRAALRHALILLAAREYDLPGESDGCMECGATKPHHYDTCLMGNTLETLRALEGDA